MVLGSFVNRRDERHAAKRSDQHGLCRASYCDVDKFRRQPAGRGAGDVRSTNLGSQRNLRGRSDYGYGNNQCFRCGDVADVHGQRHGRQLCRDSFSIRGRLPGDLLADEYNTGDELLAEHDDHRCGDHAEPHVEPIGAGSARRANRQPELQ